MVFIGYHFFSDERKNNVGLCIRFYSAVYSINYTIAFVVFIWNTCFLVLDTNFYSVSIVYVLPFMVWVPFLFEWPDVRMR